WGGAGQSLMRQYNGNTAVSIADNVQSFKIAFAPEQLLSMHDEGSGSNLKSVAPLSTNWLCEYFVPGLAPGATSWSVTHLKLQLQRNGTSTGTLTVKLYSAGANNSPSGVLASTTVDVTSISSSAPQWINVPLSQTSLTPGTGLCLVLTTGGTSTIVNAFYDNAAATSNTVYQTSTTGNGGWTPSANQSLQFMVYGAVTTP
ncbi:MAG TPA: hypothetical protein VGV35_05145, partial [Bryobacteraceae bacterium]|nr:hypothetical protein [Bryobacteraceae bacterium]